MDKLISPRTYLRAQLVPLANRCPGGSKFYCRSTKCRRQPNKTPVDLIPRTSPTIRFLQDEHFFRCQSFIASISDEDTDDEVDDLLEEPEDVKNAWEELLLIQVGISIRVARWKIVIWENFERLVMEGVSKFCENFVYFTAFRYILC
jgi:hypothetical protein